VLARAVSRGGGYEGSAPPRSVKFKVGQTAIFGYFF